MVGERTVTKFHKFSHDAKDLAGNIVNTVREPLIVLDQDLRVITASRSFYEVFQVTPEETVGRLIYDLGNKQWDIPKLRELLETILPQKTTFDDYEVEHDFAGMGKRFMLLNARQIERAMGKKQIILLAIEDITERRRLQDSLAASEERFRRLFETASDGIVLLEKDEGRIVRGNQAVEKMLGYVETDYIGEKLSGIGVPLDMNDFGAIMASLKKNGILNYQDVSVKAKSGKNVYADIYMVDKAALAQCNIRDVSERKRAEKRMAEMLYEAHEDKSRLEAILNSMGEGLSIQNTDFIIIYQNKVMKDLIGDHVGEHCFKAYENEDQVCEGCPIAMCCLDGGIHKATRVLKVGEVKKHVEITASPLRDMQGHVVAGIEVVKDISDQEKLKAQLRHAQKMEALGVLAGGIAHDFNNILSVIHGFGAMAMEGLEDGSPAMKDMNEVLIAADRGADLTSRLLAFSRKDVVEVKRVDINALILGLEKMLGRVIRESIDLNLDFAESSLIVTVDAGQIEQVLMNLAVNARDAMPEGGRLSINTCFEELDEASVAAFGYGAPGKYALITVADSGCGMDEETRKRIFDPFFTTKEIGVGTGLGLSISYAILKKHNGYIKAYSEPGEGTAFSIYLPLGQETPSTYGKSEDVVPIKGGIETILMAEDDDALRKLIKIILESFGYHVIAAKDGEEAILKFAENRNGISLVLLDMIMPKKSGKEVSEVIRKANPEMKVLFSSGYPMDIIRSDESAAADFDFIHKPFHSRELLMKVREILDR
jgi:PAS domain S-box-containing protein